MLRLFPLFALLLCFACEEIPPVVTPATPGQVEEPGNVDDQEKQVLIEEFTGVRCVNCPAGSAAIEDLLAIHGERLIAVSIHAGFFSSPSNEIPLDLRTDGGNEILNQLGEPLGYPTAVIDRTAFVGGDLQTSSGDWAGIIADELLNPVQLKIDLQPNYAEEDRALQIELEFVVEDNLSTEDVRYTVMLTESDVEGPQETPEGIVEDYQHQHVLRDILTTATGEPLGDMLDSGDRVSKSISYTLPADYDPDHIEVVAFVHLGGGEKRVVQAARKKLR